MENKTETKLTSLADFEVLSRLGEGAFAEVFKVQRKQDQLLYALKKIRMTRIKDKDRDNALNEVRLLASHHSEHLVEFKEAFYDSQAAVLYIVMEFAEKGDLQNFVQSYRRRGLRVPEEEIWKVMLHIARGLRTLHNKKVIHRDVKAANVFISQQGIYKLGDLNVAKAVGNQLARTQTGTPYYASPQIWKDQPYDSKSDMWSLGCLLYEMAAQRPPFTAPDVQTLYKKIMNGYYPRIPSQYSNDLADTIGSLLRLDPRERPSATLLLRDPLLLAHSEPLSSCEPYQSCLEPDLLRTIHLPKSNFKMINEILPKAQYDRGDKSCSNQETIMGDFFRPEARKNSNNKVRIKSMYEPAPSSCPGGRDTNTGIDRNASGLQGKPAGQSSIHSIAIFREVPNSQKLPRKQPEGTVPRCSAFGTDLPLPKLTGSRRKVESVISKMLSSEEGRGKNKQNLRRMGKEIVGGSGISSRKSVRDRPL